MAWLMQEDRPDLYTPRQLPLKPMAFKSIEVVAHEVFSNFYDPLPDTDKRKIAIKELRDNLKKDINKGRFVKRDRPYPERYRKLGVTNLFVYEVKSDRVIYTMRTTSEKKIWQFLEYLNHEEYDYLFKHKGSS